MHSRGSVLHGAVFYICYFTLFILCFSISRNNAQTRSKHTFQLIGLFTMRNCPKGEEFRCQNAESNHLSMLRVHREQQFWFNTVLCTKDIKNDAKALADYLLPLTEATGPEGVLVKDCDHKVGSHNTAGKIVRTIIFTYLSFYLTRLTSALILPSTNFLVVSVTDRRMYPSYFLENPLAVYSYESSFGFEIQDKFIRMRDNFNITYSGFFNLRTTPENKQDSASNFDKCIDISNQNTRAMCYYLKARPDGCYKEVNVNVNNETEILTAIDQAKSNNLSFLSLAGDSWSISEFRGSADLSEKIMHENFYLPFLTESRYIPENHLVVPSYKKATAFFNFPGARTTNILLDYVFDFPFELKNELESRWPKKIIWEQLLSQKKFQEFLKQKVSCAFVKFVFKDYVCGADFGVEMIRVYVKHFGIESLIGYMIENEEMLLFLIREFKRGYYIGDINEERLLKQQTFNPKHALKARPFCEEKTPICDAGRELFHSFYKEPYWTQSYGLNCRQCKKKFYKPNRGNKERCIECFYPNRVNIHHTSCYDPFQKKSLSLLDERFLYILIVPSTLLTSLTLFTMILFTVKRKTPIVLSSNLKMTALQLATHLLLFAVPIVLYLTTTPTMCIARQIFFGISFSITISINISKSQKLYMIVGKQVRMTKSEIFLTNASEWFVLMVVLFIDALIHLLSFVNKGVSVETVYHNATLIKEENCSNNLSIFIQLLMATLLSICNGIQGFRARNLPSRFRETNHVLYSSFISVVVFVASTTAYFARSEEIIDQDFIVLMVSLVFNGTHFILLYGYKVFVMVFMAEQNTKEAVDQKRLRELNLHG